MSRYSNHGKVPMFRMKPQPGYLWAAIIVLLLGVLLFFEGHRDPGDLPAQRSARAGTTRPAWAAGRGFPSRARQSRELSTAGTRARLGEPCPAGRSPPRS